MTTLQLVACCFAVICLVMIRTGSVPDTTGRRWGLWNNLIDTDLNDWW